MIMDLKKTQKTLSRLIIVLYLITQIIQTTPPYMNSNINKPQTNIEHYSWKKNNKTNNNLIVPKVGNINIKERNI